jgi:hypothetical protein
MSQLTLVSMAWENECITPTAYGRPPYPYKVMAVYHIKEKSRRTDGFLLCRPCRQYGDGTCNTRMYIRRAWVMVASSNGDRCERGVQLGHWYRLWAMGIGLTWSGFASLRRGLAGSLI